MEKHTHVIIGGPRLSENNIIYRRRRLLEYLAAKESTSKILWIYFNPNSNKKLGELSYPKLPKKYNKYPYYKIKQIEISDYRYLLSFITFFQGGIVKKILKEIGENDNNFLWYTLHRFASLSKLKIWKKTMYDCSDNWTNKDSKGLLNKILDFLTTKSENLIIKNTETHTTSSPYLKNKVELLSNKKCHLIEHGFNPSMFSNTPKVEKSGNKLCFIGALQGNKVDTGLLYAVAVEKKEWEIHIIGPVPEENLKTTKYKLFENLDNVFIHGPVEPDQIPFELGKMDLGLLPYKDTEFTKGIFPLKFYEYLAANLNVVGCNLSSLTRFQEIGVYSQSDGSVDGFIDSCKVALSLEVPYKLHEQLLKEATWEKRFDKMYSYVLTKKAES